MSERSRQKQKARQELEAKARAERGESYTDDELTKMMHGNIDPLLIDDRRIRCGVFIPGRYYSRMFFFNFPKWENPPHGGDVTGYLWRRDDDPRTWFLRWRFRYYAGGRIFDGKDTKNWYRCEIKEENEALVVAKAMSGFGLIANVLADQKLEEFIIQGDYQKAINLMQNELTRPKWMHMKIMPAEEVAKGTDPMEYAADQERRETN